MFLDFTKVEKIFLVTGKTDLRKGIDGLARIIQQDYELDVYEDAIFLFCGNRCDRFKLLYWHNDGFFLRYKRIENGRLQWPRKKEEVRQLSVQQIHFTGYSAQESIAHIQSCITITPNRELAKYQSNFWQISTGICIVMATQAITRWKTSHSFIGKCLITRYL
ncbi:IS66 family insertion sequence element accessory protein TnpB [Enterococcus sp. DIV0187]|uniref:IS66 family insertion sequence element accessory protein TnpB n=1 Tax=Enterococcus sp. DIV0187 TaxID=2774644 RepID=UPI003F28E85C